MSKFVWMAFQRSEKVVRTWPCFTPRHISKCKTNNYKKDPKQYELRDGENIPLCIFILNLLVLYCYENIK